MTDAPARPYTDRDLLVRLLRAARPQRGWLAVLLLLDLVAAPLYLLTPLPLKLAIDSVIGDDPIPGFLDAVVPDAWTSSDLRLLGVVAALQIIAVLLIQLQTAAQLVLQKRTGERLTVGLRARLFRHIQRLSFSFLDSRGTADSIYRVQYDTPAIEWLTIHGIIPLVGAVATLGSMVYVTARIDPALALVALTVVPVLLVMMRLYKTRMRRRYREAKELQSSALNVVQETLGAFRVVKVFGREREHTRQFQEQSDRSIRAQVYLAAAEGVYGLGIQMTTAAATAVVLYLGTRSVLAGTMTLGSLTLVMAYLAQLFSPLKTISSTIASLQSYFSSAERVFEVLDEVPDVEDRPGARSLGRAEGRITLRDVRFSYDDQSDVLADVSAEIAAGSRVGIFGQTGAGKSTLVSLVMRVYEPSGGAVLLDGVDVRDIRIEDLREQFSVVLQDSVLFSTTIAENIAYGRTGSSREEIEAAARAAGAHDFILSLPDGYETVVGERGMRMSGGERQRIALARAFLKDAPILILDEPTSSVDVQTETAIMESMLALMEGRTTFMIAHRLSTLDVCDTFLHVEEGRVVQTDAPPREAVVVASSAPVGAFAGDPVPGRAVPAARRGPAGGRGGLSDHELAGVLRRACDDLAGHDVEVVRTSPEPMGAGLLVTVDLDGASRRTYRVQRLAAEPVARAGVPYVVHVHERVLERCDLAHPRLLGRTHDDDALWLVFDHPEGAWRLHEIATVEAMESAARWLATFHAVHEFEYARDMPELRRYHLDDFVAWADRAHRVADDGRLPRWVGGLAGGFAEVADLLPDPPQTAIVGDAYGANMLVDGVRVYPIDFSGAAVGAGELDLASLLEGWPAGIVQRCRALYRRVRWPDGPADLFDLRLDVAQVALHLRWLGAPTDDPVPAWRIDELDRLSRRLNLR